MSKPTNANGSILDTSEVAVVGAGTAGCFVASVLAQSGCDVTIVEKSRGIGGRCSRRSLAGDSIDLGAAGFRSDRLIYYPKQAHLWRKRLQHWIHQHWITRWTFSVADFGSPEQVTMDQQLCGIPNMNSLQRHLVESVPVRTHTRVAKLEWDGRRWRLYEEGGDEIMRADKVVLTLPPQQALSLFDGEPPWRDVIEPAAAQSRAQWITVLHLDRPQLHLADVYRGDHPVLADVIRDSAKPLRRHQGEYWVLQSTLDWADQHIDFGPDHIAQEMKAAFLQCVEMFSEPAIVSCHRWLLAHHEEWGDSPGHLWCPQRNIGYCGDWLAGGGISGALMSGQQLVDVLLLNQVHKGVTV